MSSEATGEPDRNLRRSTRVTAKSKAAASESPVERPKTAPQRKMGAADDKKAAEKLDHFLTNSRSKLTKIEISVSGVVLETWRFHLMILHILISIMGLFFRMS